MVPQQNDNCCKPGRKLSPGTRSPCTLGLDFQASKPVRNKCLLFNLLSLWCFVIVVQAKTCVLSYKETITISKRSYYSPSLSSPFQAMFFQFLQIVFTWCGFSSHHQLTTLLMMTSSLPICIFQNFPQKKMQ